LIQVKNAVPFPAADILSPRPLSRLFRVFLCRIIYRERFSLRVFLDSFRRTLGSEEPETEFYELRRPIMKLGMRRPSLKKSLRARTTGKVKRAVKKAVVPGYGKKGMGWLKNPKKALYNKIYKKTSFSLFDVFR
jgi:hypothetical protein